MLREEKPVVCTGILATPLEWTLVQGACAGLPAGPFQPPHTRADAPIYPAMATHYQITAAKRNWKRSKNIWKELYNAEDGGKETWIEACDDDVLDELRDPLLGFGSVAIHEMVTFIFDEYSVFDRVTRKQLGEMMTETWTDGCIQPEFVWINRAVTTYTRHSVILCEDEKVNIVVEVIEDSVLLAADCSEWRKRDEANKTRTNVQAHFKKAAKDLKFQKSTRSGGFYNAVQQTANLTAETIDQQAAAIDSANTLVQHSNTLCANYAKRVGKLEAHVTHGNSDDGGGTSGYNSGQLPKLTFVQFI